MLSKKSHTMNNPLERETRIAGATVHRTTSLPDIVTPETPRALIMGGLMSEEGHYTGLRTELAKLGWIATTFDPPSQQSFAKRFHPSHRDVLRVRGQVPWGVMKDVNTMLTMQGLAPPEMGTPKHILVPHSLAAHDAAQLTADKRRAEKVEQIILVAAACLGEHSLRGMVLPAFDFVTTNALPAAGRRINKDLHEPNPIRALGEDIIYSLGYGARLAWNADRRLRELYAAATRRLEPHLHDTKHNGVIINAIHFDDDPFSTHAENEVMSALVGYHARLVRGNHLTPQEEPDRTAREVVDAWGRRFVPLTSPEKVAA